MSMDYFRIGLFLRPHGIKGELKLLPLTDDLKRFARLSDAFIEAPEGVYQTVTAESARVAAENSVIIKLKGIDTVEAAEKLRDKYLCVDREHAVKLPAGAYFVKDIIGCEVFRHWVMRSAEWSMCTKHRQRTFMLSKAQKGFPFLH